MKKKLIYLASPYSKYPGGRLLAFREACQKAGELMEQGLNVFCPIAHSHSIEEWCFDDRKDGDWWLKQDFAVLEHCDELYVYMMPGWKESYGVGAEIDYAEQLNIPIKFVHYDRSRTVREAA